MSQVNSFYLNVCIQQNLLHGDEHLNVYLCDETLTVNQIFMQWMELIEIDDKLLTVASLRELLSSILSLRLCYSGEIVDICVCVKMLHGYINN